MKTYASRRARAARAIRGPRTIDSPTAESQRFRRSEARLRTLNGELESRLRARTAELEAARADQDALTRVISHDLRQPLRHIEAYAAILAEDYDGRGNPFLERVQEAGLRMGRMVDSLLELARIGAGPVVRRPVSLSAIAIDLTEELSRVYRGRRIEYRIAPGLEADADERLMEMLLRELLDNAHKFTRDAEPAVVEFGRRDGVFYVRDNGAGFDAAHSERMFEAFERLHHVDEFEGEGVGLAKAARIVRRHGGRIWAEGGVGEGTTIRFTLRDGVSPERRRRQPLRREPGTGRVPEGRSGPL